MKYKCRAATFDPPLCDYESDKRWLGRCPGCQRYWDPVRHGYGDDDRARRSLAALALKPVERMLTGIKEFDKVLGGGLVKGSTVLLSGEAGAGKSTLLLQTADGVARGKRSVLYASAEQNARDIGTFAARLGVLNEQVDVMAGEDDLYKIVGEAERKKPALLVLDSINQVYADDLKSDVNSSRQIEAAGTYLTSFGKKEDIAVIIVCHQAKDGSIRAPQVLVHLVDTVVYFDPYLAGGDDEDEEDESAKNLRVVESGKNRNGPSGIREFLEMTESGLKTPSKMRPKLILV